MEEYQDLDFVSGCGVFSWDKETTVFIDKGLIGIATPHCDPIIIIVGHTKSVVARLLVDKGAVVNVLYVDCWQQMVLPKNHRYSHWV